MEERLPAASEEPESEKPSALESFTRSIDIHSVALTGLFILAMIYFLHFARQVLLPTTLAVLLNFLLRPVIQKLEKIHIPPSLGAVIVMALFCAVLGIVGLGLSVPARTWAERAPTMIRQVSEKLERFRQPMEKVSAVAEKVGEIAQGVPGAKVATEVQVQKSILESTLVANTQAFIAGVVIVFILLYFLLASGDFFLRKLIKVLPKLSDKKLALRIATEMQRDISRYFVTVTLINIGLGAALSLGFWAIGLPNPVLWGALGGLMNFIPYLGAAVNIPLTTLVALLTFDSLGQVLLVPVVYFAINSVEGSIVTPLILGKRFTLNPVIIFFWLIFWGWLWGVPGALLSVPMLTALKIFCDHIEGLDTLGEFLGGSREQSP